MWLMVDDSTKWSDYSSYQKKKWVEWIFTRNFWVRVGTTQPYRRGVHSVQKSIEQFKLKHFLSAPLIPPLSPLFFSKFEPSRTKMDGLDAPSGNHLVPTGIEKLLNIHGEPRTPRFTPKFVPICHLAFSVVRSLSADSAHTHTLWGPESGEFSGFRRQIITRIPLRQ